MGFGDFSVLKTVWPPLSVPFVVETAGDELGWDSEPTNALYRSLGAIRIPYEWRIQSGAHK